MGKLSTAEKLLANNIDYIKEVIDDEDLYIFYRGVICEFAKEFAKLHVEAALKQASEKATVTPIDHEEISEGSFRPIWGVDDDSIINSYPLTNIK